MNLLVIGGGLAGSEAAWQAAQRATPVVLYEMRPGKTTPAHTTGLLAELVCSNSLGARSPDRPVGLLKEEMKLMGSLIVETAEETAVPAGGALAVDREAFAQRVTQRLAQHPLIKLVRQEVKHLPDEPVVVATGPLTSEAMSQQIEALTGTEYLHFFDAMAPIVEADTIDMSVAYRGSRYERGEQQEGDYINCPMSEAEYGAFVDALLAAQVTPLREFERGDERFFEACLPIEVLARRGQQALAFGPLRPVGLLNPRTGQRPHAVVQLRQDNLAASLYNMVGFQTNLRWAEQERVFRLIPGLKDAQFVRFGQMHRNTYINSPDLLEPTLQLRLADNERSAPVWMAGQITGTEGYVGSAMGGIVAGLNAVRWLRGEPQIVFPEDTMTGSLLHYITHGQGRDFQPMKANFGLLPALLVGSRGRRDRCRAHADRALQSMRDVLVRHGLSLREHGSYEAG